MAAEDSGPDPALLEKWTKEQDELKALSKQQDPVVLDASKLRFIAGTDISFVKGSDVSVSCIAVTTPPPENTLVWSQTRVCSIDTPYIPGFLAFREVGPLMAIADSLRAECASGAGGASEATGAEDHAPATPNTSRTANNADDSGGWPVVTWRHPSIAVQWPDVFLVDGNGALHPRGFGLACHLGVLLRTPTIGIGKTLMAVDGLTREGYAALEAAQHGEGGMQGRGASTQLVGDSGATHGAAVILGAKARKPTYVSVGHAVDLDTAVAVALAASSHRVPEAIRHADHIGRERVRSGLQGTAPPVPLA